MFFQLEEFVLPLILAELSTARVFRILTASKMVDEVSVNKYAANDLTRAFLQPGIGDANTHG